MEHLNLSGTKITDEGLKDLASLTELKNADTRRHEDYGRELRISAWPQEIERPESQRHTDQ